MERIIVFKFFKQGNCQMAITCSNTKMKTLKQRLHLYVIHRSPLLTFNVFVK